MMSWIKSVLGGFDRTHNASERMGKAMEDIADELEYLRDGLRMRLRGEVSIAPEMLTEQAAGKRKGGK